MKVSRLNEVGIRKFSEWLEILKTDGTKQIPITLLTDPETVESMDIHVTIEFKKFLNRFEAAKYFHAVFKRDGLINVEQDRGLWAWLSLFYFDTVCPIEKDGIRKPGASARHILESGNFQRYYRHLLAGPYRIYHAHRDNPELALAVLCQPLDSPGDVVEQLASRQQVVTNSSVLSLATILYVDKKTQKLKRGAGGKSDGSVRRLYDVLEQFQLTWDLYAATPEELCELMPKEFSKYLV